MSNKYLSTKEIVRIYNLDKSTNVDLNPFYNTLMEEFITRLVNNNGLVEYTKFNHSVTELKMKFEAIANKSIVVLTDEQWKFIYAAYISKLRDFIYPDYKFGHSPNNTTINILQVITKYNELQAIVHNQSVQTV